MGTILTHQLLRKRLSELRVRVEACEAASPEGARNSAGLFELEVLLEELLLQFEALYDAQGMLEESSAKVTEFFDLAPIPYFVLDQYGVILRANVAAARLLGREPRALVQRPFVSCVRLENSFSFWRHLVRCLQSDDTVKSAFRFIAARGSRDVWAHSARVLDSRGVPIGSRMLLTDIAELEVAPRPPA